MEIRIEKHENPVADEVAALFAVVRPILDGLLHALKQDVVAEVGGVEQVKLKMLQRLYRPGGGDCGICFEYAVHDGMRRGDAGILDRVDTALGLCNIPGGDLSSILFGAERTGSQQLAACQSVVCQSPIASSMTRGVSCRKGITAQYRGHVVAFCSEEHRELCVRSVEYFDRLIDELPSSGQTP